MSETTTQTQPPALSAGTWTIDPTHSEVGFTVRHLGMSKVRGRFNRFEGSVTIADDLTTAAVSAAIDLGSVDTNNDDRDGHLQSTDFFNAENHPSMTFASTLAGPRELAGDLTINGITRPVTLDLETHGVTVDGYGTTRAGFSASTTIKRSDFGINFNMPIGLDGMLISDKVSVELEIQAVPA